MSAEQRAAHASQKGDYSPDYKVEHYDGKGRVAEWMKAQPSELDNGITWSVVTTGPYMDMLNIVSVRLMECPIELSAIIRSERQCSVH